MVSRLAVFALFVTASASAVEPRPQQCDWLRSRYTLLWSQYQAGDSSQQLQREMQRFRTDYHANQCEGPIILR